MKQYVLVHYDHALGPIGAWGFLDGRLKHFYPESLDVGISSRAREIMAARRDTTVPEFFALLDRCDPSMLDNYQLVKTPPGVSLPAVVAEVRRSWVRSD